MLTLANIASAIQDAFRHRVEIWRTPPAAAAGDEAGTGADFHRWRSECDALILKLFGPADVSSYPTYPPLLGSELFDTDSESNTAQN